MKIREYENDDYREKKGIHIGGRREIPPQPADKKGRAGQQLDKRVLKGYWGAAITAFAPQKEVGKNRDVIVIRDLTAAPGAAGTGEYDRFSQRDPVNADIQEAPDDKAQYYVKNQDWLHPGILMTED